MNAESFKKSRNEVLSLYGKNESDMAEYKEILREWMKKEPHLPSDLIEDDFLEIYLLKNKFSVEKTKSKIENYCTLKSLNQYKYIYEDDIYPVPSRESQFYIPITKLTDQYHRILIGKIWNEEKWTIVRDVQNALLIREVFCHIDYSDGEIIILDYSLCSPMLITKFRVNVVVDSITLCFKAYSARIHQIHLISKGASAIFALWRPFMPEKMKSRLFMHDSFETLKNAVPPSCLPKDFGGELKSLDEIRADMDVMYANNQEIFKKYMNTKSNEELRIGESYTEDMKGTFKKLNID